MTLPPTPTTIRRRALAAGIHGDAIASTRPADLELVIAAGPQLRLVFDADDETIDNYPRLGNRLTTEQKIANRHADMSLDELASVATFARGELIESAFHSADYYTPLDEYTGGGAA